MKNVRELKFDELVYISGGELPYTEHSLNGRAIADQLHHVGDFFRGFWAGLTGIK